MLSQLKNFTGIFFLVLFLYPQVQKGFHDFEHRNDSHCNAITETHLHQQEHVCSLCDFSIAVNIPGFDNDPYVFLNIISFQFGEALFPHTFSIFWKSLPPRAPPVV